MCLLVPRRFYKSRNVFPFFLFQTTEREAEFCQILSVFRYFLIGIGFHGVREGWSGDVRVVDPATRELEHGGSREVGAWGFFHHALCDRVLLVRSHHHFSLLLSCLLSLSLSISLFSIMLSFYFFYFLESEIFGNCKLSLLFFENLWKFWVVVYACA